MRNDLTWFAANSTPWLGPLLVTVGGALGATSRYLLGSTIDAKLSRKSKLHQSNVTRMPWGTIAVNVIGSFIIGVLMTIIPVLVLTRVPFPIMATNAWIGLIQLLFVTGFCGGFTTFSTATLDAITLARSGHIRKALVSVGMTLVATIGAVALGIGLTAFAMLAATSGN